MITSEQIRHIIQARGWTQVDLADAVSVKQSTVSRWLSGQQRPDAEQQELLQALFEDPVDAFGDGKSTSDPETRKATISRARRLIASHLANRKRGNPAPALPEYDLRAGASYGGGYVVQHVSEDGEPTANHEAVKAEWVIPPSFLQGELRLSPNSTDIIAIDGPSMVPDLMPGDRVLIDRSHRDPRQGGIFAVREDDSVIIKHVEVVRGSDPLRIICKSSNPTYSPFELILDGENVAIIGRVAGRISRM